MKTTLILLVSLFVSNAFSFNYTCDQVIETQEEYKPEWYNITEPFQVSYKQIKWSINLDIPNVEAGYGGFYEGQTLKFKRSRIPFWDESMENLFEWLWTKKDYTGISYDRGDHVEYIYRFYEGMMPLPIWWVHEGLTIKRYIFDKEKETLSYYRSFVALNDQHSDRAEYLVYKLSCKPN